MSEIHVYERRQFEKLFKEEKIDRFEDRFKVLEAFLQEESHVSAAELTAALSGQKIPLSPDFVEDTLEMMCRFGFAQKTRFNPSHTVSGLLREMLQNRIHSENNIRVYSVVSNTLPQSARASP
jgi:Fe2+ or Zn2+ uptake regulation protein